MPTTAKEIFPDWFSKTNAGQRIAAEERADLLAEVHAEREQLVSQRDAIEAEMSRIAAEYRKTYEEKMKRFKAAQQALLEAWREVAAAKSINQRAEAMGRDRDRLNSRLRQVTDPAITAFCQRLEWMFTEVAKAQYAGRDRVVAAREAIRQTIDAAQALALEALSQDEIARRLAALDKGLNAVCGLC